MKSVKSIKQYSVSKIINSLKYSILFRNGSANGCTNPRIITSVTKLKNTVII